MQALAADSSLPPPAPAGDSTMLERRQRSGAAPYGVERRQFASTYTELSEEARDLALAVDGYKLQHRRRYLTYEELLVVIKRLGYSKGDAALESLE